PDPRPAWHVSQCVVGSYLDKSAVYGADANWERVIAAVGYSGAEINPDTIDMFIGPEQLLRNSQPASYSEGAASAYLKEDTVKITIDLNVGEGAGKAWGWDLPYD